MPSKFTFDYLPSTIKIVDNVDPTKQITFDLTNISSGASRSFVFPNSDVTIAGNNEPAVLENKTLDAPIISNKINDSNNNTILSFTSTTNAINTIDIANSAVNNGPIISSQGADPNINLNLNSKGGNGRVVLDGFIYPKYDGSSGQYLATNGNKTLYFAGPTGDIPIETLFTTTTNVFNTVTTYTIPTNSICTFTTEIIGTKIDLTEFCSFKIYTIFRNINSIITGPFGNNKEIIKNSSNNNADAQLIVDANYITPQVKGNINGITYNWKISTKIKFVSI